MTTTRNGEWALRRRRSIHAQAAGLYWSSFVSAELIFFSSSFHFYTFFRLASCCCSVEFILQDFSLILRLSISVIYCSKMIWQLILRLQYNVRLTFGDVVNLTYFKYKQSSHFWRSAARASAKQRNPKIIPPRLFIYTWSIPALQQQHSGTKVLVHILFINRRIISFTSFQVKVEEKPLKKTL